MGAPIFDRRSLLWKIYIAMIATFFIPMMLISAFNLASGFYLERHRNAANVDRGLAWGADMIAEHADLIPTDELAAWLAGMELSDNIEVFIRRDGVLYARDDVKWLDRFLSGAIGSDPHDPSVTVALSDSGRTEAALLLTIFSYSDPFSAHMMNWIALILAALFSLAASFLIVRDHTRPLRELRGVAAKLAEGDYSVRAHESVMSSSAEVAELGAALDRMAERVSGSIEAQKRLLVDISHEIRSPLQRMDVAVELARDASELGRGKQLDRVELEIERIDSMVEELLLLTRTDSPAETRAPVDLAALIGSVASDAEFEGSIDGKSVTAELTSMTVLGDEGLLKRAIAGVVDNAVRYAPAQSSVEISAVESDDGSSARITVRDHGCGVSEADVERIFMPYFRTDEARERSQGGTGLGLSITRRIVELHGGSVSALNAQGGGLEVNIVLPLAEKSQYTAFSGEHSSAPRSATAGSARTQDIRSS